MYFLCISLVAIDYKPHLSNAVQCGLGYGMSTQNDFENILKLSIFGSIGLGLPSKVCTKYKKTLRDQNIY